MGTKRPNLLELLSCFVILLPAQKGRLNGSKVEKVQGTHHHKPLHYRMKALSGTGFGGSPQGKTCACAL